MFGKSYPLFRLFGFEVRADLSWLVLAALITWSLAAGVFPTYIKGLTTVTYWWMGVVGTLALFASIILHELSHSLVARSHGLPMKGITLFIFGGVAQMEEEPPSPGTEFLMAIAGPVASIVVGGACLGLGALGSGLRWPIPALGVIDYLGWINLVLAGFNLLPAFPLDGGRVLRSILWKVKSDLRWATRIASMAGSGFGFLLIFLGVVSMFRGALIGGLWWLLIGMFLNSAAQMSYRQLLTRRALEGEPVSRFMRRDPVTVPRSISIQELVDEYIYTHHYKMFPVVDGERLVGCVTTAEVKAVPRDEWARHTVGEIAQPCTEDNTLHPDADATHALALMHQSGLSRVLITEDGHLAGVLSLKDLMRFMALKLDLGDERIRRMTRR
jgi:Zn-dependent protease/CBS domain-containing protein